MSDWTEPAQSAARKIMTLLGYSQEPSDEPGDRLRDRVAVLVQQAIDARADTRETGLREAAEIARYGDVIHSLHGKHRSIHGPAIATAIEAAISSPPPPQSGEREVEASIQALRDLIEGYGAHNPQCDYERPVMQRARAAIAALNVMQAQEKEKPDV